MQPIDKNKVEKALQNYHGQTVFIHTEVNPGCFVRNAAVRVEQAYIAGEHPYRVALRIDHGGWIRVEGLTDYEIDEQNRLLLAGHDDRGRIISNLELSLTPFTFGEEVKAQ